MVQQLAYSIPEACVVANQGRNALYDAINAGKLKARKLGKRTIILDGDLRAYLDDLPLLNDATKVTVGRRRRKRGAK